MIVAMQILPGFKKSFALLSVFFVLVGCNQLDILMNPELDACEVFSKSLLKSSSSYHRVSYKIFDTQVDHEIYSRASGSENVTPLEKSLWVDTAIRGVIIQYNADNNFGSSISAKAACAFAMNDAKNDGYAGSDPEDQVKRMISTNEYRVLLGKNALDREPLPCCLAPNFDLNEINSSTPPSSVSAGGKQS